MKKILTKVKLQIPAGQANPAPPWDFNFFNIQYYSIF